MLPAIDRRLARDLRELGLLLRERVGALLELAPPAGEELVDGEVLRAVRRWTRAISKVGPSYPTSMETRER